MGGGIGQQVEDAAGGRGMVREREMTGPGIGAV